MQKNHQLSKILKMIFILPCALRSALCALRHALCSLRHALSAMLLGVEL